MVNIISRMRKLHELLWIRCGPGALILPKEVSKISMEFNTKLYGGHRGARKFWREMLPRIKYRNPSIPIAIERHSEPTGPSLLHIYTHASSSPAAADQAPTHTIDIRDQEEAQILDALVKAVGATPIAPTPQEEVESQEIAEFKVRSEKDRVQVRDKLLKERREQELLKVARGEVPAIN
ncbi:CI-B8 domain-containing protein [Phaeosphaeriaceae sp. PMI808]|nr:CI-B8 domain-containing protein [Phaeosphaeriaceae sp. PMI808]